MFKKGRWGGREGEKEVGREKGKDGEKGKRGEGKVEIPSIDLLLFTITILIC